MVAAGRRLKFEIS